MIIYFFYVRNLTDTRDLRTANRVMSDCYRLAPRDVTLVAMCRRLRIHTLRQQCAKKHLAHVKRVTELTGAFLCESSYYAPISTPELNRRE
ncbi:hypothetical protein EVAR_7425_1 [Eumeta japonica]|uniref:Uncharacterized protein n=1 Tax=Eumeta variegata TaxID=151549 RepID=A0A4C1V7T8_EUMVA|nr:hypothetical protein EVAR_7425_1 [Eumeta japonica]